MPFKDGWDFLFPPIDGTGLQSGFVNIGPTTHCFHFTHHGFRLKIPILSRIWYALWMYPLHRQSDETFGQAGRNLLKIVVLSRRFVAKSSNVFKYATQTIIWRYRSDAWTYQHPEGVNFWLVYYVATEVFYLTENVSSSSFWNNDFGLQGPYSLM